MKKKMYELKLKSNQTYKRNIEDFAMENKKKKT